MDVMFFSSVSRSISFPFNSRTMPKSFFTRTVVAPDFFTFASTEHAMVTSRSVAVFFRAQKHVGQNRQRRASADDVLDGLQPGEDLFFRDREVHVRLIVN